MSTRRLVSGETLAVPLTFGTAAGSATRGTDYTLSGASGTGLSYQNLNSGRASVTFTGPSSGTTATVATLTLSAVVDNVEEPTAETVDIGLGTLNANSGTGLDGGASGIDNLALFDIVDPVVNSVNLSVSDDGKATEGGGALTITATLDSANDSGAAISIPIQVVADDTTAQSSDYTVASSISIANNAQSGSTSFTVTDDQIAEGEEVVVLELGDTLAPDIVAGVSTVGVTIADNDTAGLVTSPTSLDVDEGDDESYTVRLATQPTGTVTVAITGQSGTDLTLDATSLTFTTANWNTAQTVTVTAGEDPDTTDDTAALTHTASGGGYSVTATVAVTVNDNDTEPVVSFASSSSSAGEASGTANVTVNLSPAPTAATTTLSYTVDGTATAGSDFSISGSGTLSVSSGATTATIAVAITDDAAEENSETVVLTLTAGNGYTVGSPSGHTLTIVDDDGSGPPTPTVSLSAFPNPVTEGGSVTVTARLSEGLSSSVTIRLTLTAGTAEPEDYGSLGSITVSGGQTTGTGTVTMAQDADEDNETFTVALGSLPPEVTVGSPSSVQVTIRDDDGTPDSPDPPDPPEPVVNNPPTARVSCDPYSVVRSGELRLTATASDPDGDSLTYRWSAPAGRFTGLTDRSSARWTAPAETGRVTITLRVSDGEDSASATCTVEVVNRPPAFEEPVYRFELAENLAGRPQSVPLGQVAAVDPDGDELTYDVSGGDREHFRPGEVRKVVTGVPGKTGLVYTLDRETGEFLWARPTVAQNVISDIEGATGTVTENAEVTFIALGQEVLACPTWAGGRTGSLSTDPPKPQWIPCSLGKLTSRTRQKTAETGSLYQKRLAIRLAVVDSASL